MDIPYSKPVVMSYTADALGEMFVPAQYDYFCVHYGGTPVCHAFDTQRCSDMGQFWPVWSQ